MQRCCVNFVKIASYLLPMKHLFLKYSWLPVLLLLSSCWKEPNYPAEPSIEFKSISQENIKDTLGNEVVRIYIALNFKDGDGNLGLNEEEILNAPYNDPADAKKQNNFFIKAYFQDKGQFVPYPELVLENGYRFPRLEPTNQIQSLEGELRYFFDINPTLIPFKFPDYKSGDLVKFDIYITDRNFNKSNTIQTEAVPVNEP